MRALITGGCGYIGSYLTKALLVDDWQVTTIDSQSNNDVNIPNYSHNLRRHMASICNHDAVARAMHGVDLVYHLAFRGDWSSHPRQAMKLTYVNAYGTATVLAMARKAGVDRVVFTSTSEVYGNLVPAAETDPCNPVTMRGSTALAAEAICRGFYQSGMEVVILRLGEVWGGRYCNSDVQRFVNRCHKIIGDPDQTRDYVHISDVVNALKKAPRWDSNVYNVGSGEEITLSGLWHMINGDESLKYENSRWNEVFRCFLDLKFTEHQTNWTSKIKLSELSKEEIAQLCEPLGVS